MKVRRLGAGSWVVAGALLVAALAPACSDGEGLLADPLPCSSPTPFPPQQRRDPQGEFRYRMTVISGVDRLSELVNQFRVRWPDGKFSRDSAFRTEFARYADESTCLATGLRNLNPPLPRYETFDVAFDAAATVMMKTISDGREAIKSRNVSDYRDWNGAIDGRLSEVRQTFQLLPR